jgi:divalent metal cation (Fe/Co/Zn/Cd) transporter
MFVLEMARTVGRELATLPWLVRIGLAVMAAAFIGDLAVHLMSTEHHPAGHRVEEHLAHLAGVVGMVLVLGGVALSGARRHRSTRRSLHATR